MTEDKKNIQDLIELVDILRGEDGCPWDKVQTHSSIKNAIVEESYEVLDAIEKNDYKAMTEELGDVLFQVIFHASIEKNNGKFTLEDIITGIYNKMVFRHPHVFQKENNKVEKEGKPAAGSDQEKWVGKSAENKEEVKTELPEEMTITQEMRQDGFDRKTTTDDHGMHIYGLAEDQNGSKYFIVKNSWGETGKYDGIWYASDAFVRYKTLNIVVHKDALPKDLKKKLGIK